MAEFGNCPIRVKNFWTGLVCAKACAPTIIIVICAVNLNSMGKPLPQANNVEVTVESVRNNADQNVIRESTITNIKASG